MECQSRWKYWLHASNAYPGLYAPVADRYTSQASLHTVGTQFFFFPFLIHAFMFLELIGRFVTGLVRIHTRIHLLVGVDSGASFIS